MQHEKVSATILSHEAYVMRYICMLNLYENIKFLPGKDASNAVLKDDWKVCLSV